MTFSIEPEVFERTPREIRKRATILKAAQEVFFANGYVGTSMDLVAAKAAVSKQTVYKHFISKTELFREVVTDVVRARDAGITIELFTSVNASFEEQLCSFARFFLAGIMQSDVLKLRRLVIGEAGRFPDLGEVFYNLAPKRAGEQLALVLRELSSQNGLYVKDPVMAAEHLLCLILSIPLDRAMFLGDQHGMTDGELQLYADEGVRIFLRAYRT